MTVRQKINSSCLQNLTCEVNSIPLIKYEFVVLLLMTIAGTKTNMKGPNICAAPL